MCFSWDMQSTDAFWEISYSFSRHLLLNYRVTKLRGPGFFWASWLRPSSLSGTQAVWPTQITKVQREFFCLRFLLFAFFRICFRNLKQHWKSTSGSVLALFVSKIFAIRSFVMDGREENIGNSSKFIWKKEKFSEECDFCKKNAPQFSFIIVSDMLSISCDY